MAEREGQVLTLGQGLIGALACIAMVLIAIIGTFGRGAIDGGDAVEVYLVTLGFLAPVFAVFVTSQVPVGGVPRTRTVPVGRILGALGLALALHFAAVLAVTGGDPEVFDLFHPFALFHLVWALAVLGLLSIRLVSYPVKLTDGLLIMLICGAGISAYVQGAMWAADGGRGSAHLFAFAELSPVLGLAQVAWMIAIPALLVRGLKRNLKAIAPGGGEVPEAPAKPAG